MSNGVSNTDEMFSKSGSVLWEQFWSIPVPVKKSNGWIDSGGLIECYLLFSSGAAAENKLTFIWL